MKSKSRGKPLSNLFFIMGALVIIFAAIWYLSAQNSGLATRFALDVGDREPVPVPGDPTPPLPPCPTKFVDHVCELVEGRWTDPIMATALNVAAKECSRMYTKCTNNQRDEFYANQRVCQSVTGCQLYYDVIDDKCEQGGPENCREKNTGSSQSPIYVQFCVIDGEYSITNYSCRRP